MNALNRIPGFKNRWVRGGAIALLALLGLTLFLAPNTSRGSGSTYSRAPDGYGAWFEYMAEQGTPIQRWQRPFTDLINTPDGVSNEPMTLLQVHIPSQYTGVDYGQQQWVSQGNRLIIAGVRGSITPAPFSRTINSEAGPLLLETGRRLNNDINGKLVLSDSYGAIALKETVDKGEIIYIISPYIASNAYQDTPGNFKFLATLMAQSGYTPWVDEYLHGYKDSDVITEEAGGSWVSYLAGTPVVLVVFQLAIVLLVMIFAENQRFGLPAPLTTPTPNNSKAYIEALASVLQKANSSEFILDAIGKEEQRQLQKALGLGNTLLAPQPLIEAWVQQTGRSPTEIDQVFRPYWQKRQMSEADLLAWIKTVHALRQHLPA
ncbi:MAG TPA: DUF4350 domain-containing protein [Chroococcidiopsis sp.]